MLWAHKKEKKFLIPTGKIGTLVLTETDFKLVMCRVIYQFSFKSKVLGPLKSFSWIPNYKGQSELSIYLKGKTRRGTVSTAVGCEW